MPSSASRRRVLYVQHPPLRQTVEFHRTINQEVAASLALKCDVEIVQGDFDYAAACDRFKPDFAIFEFYDYSGPVQVRNAGARPDIPRMGFHFMDPHGPGRVHMLRALDQLGIENFFTYGVSILSQSPEFLHRAYALPMQINGDIYRDYGLEKLIPISVFGGLMAPEFYKWRAETLQHITNHFPTLIYTHPGYAHPPPRHRFPVMGADYAKLLNRSYYALSDTTREDYLVRKHLEIPACGAILISPDTPEVALYGFRDMQNCILGSGAPLFEKIAAVADDPELYRTICRNGHDLVHSRHTWKSWIGILDWYECRRALRPGEIVQQQGLFGPFIAVPGGANVPAFNGAATNSEFTAGMRAAWQAILSGADLDKAETILTGMRGWLDQLNEPIVPLAIIALLRGRPVAARELLTQLFAIRVHHCGDCSFPDPEEMAWLMLAAALEGNAKVLHHAMNEARDVRHLGLRRMQALLESLLQGHELRLTPDHDTTRSDDRVSIHWTGQMTAQEWLSLTNRILRANAR